MVKEGKMKSPRERYHNDLMFHQLVDLMTSHIMQAKYTPSEMRDAALLASILYEEMNLIPRVYPQEILDWLDGREKSCKP